LTRSQPDRPDRAYLVGVGLPGVGYGETDDSLDELEKLLETYGAEIAGRVVQERNKPDPAFFIGRGKVEEIKSRASFEGATMVAFDDELSPSQTKNLEDHLHLPVIDRTGLILQIFGLRARTREAKTQVELAQLQYTLPRLRRLWIHLSRQRGGIGLREVGESQLELDRRLIRNRIARLRRDLARIERYRATQRQRRRNTPRICLVGYTNVGKSTLLNKLTTATVLTEDRLFATLDSTTRAISLGSHAHALLTDTVGFIRKLPHSLVASFRSTLEETREADLLLHVVDLSHPHYRDQIETVEETLADMGLADSPVIIAFNKVDRAPEGRSLKAIRERYPHSVMVSAHTGEGLEELTDRVRSFFSLALEETEVVLPYSKMGVVGEIYDRAEVLETHYEALQVRVRFRAAVPIVRSLAQRCSH